MHVLATRRSSTATYRVWHDQLSLDTHRAMEFVDITDVLRVLIARRQAWRGLLNVQTRHTTTGVVVNEHEPLLLSDLGFTLERLAPRWAAYHHDDPVRRTVNVTAEERVNGHAHCQALLLPPAVCLNVVDGALSLGRWQRVFFVELDGGQTRSLSVVFTGEVLDLGAPET